MMLSNEKHLFEVPFPFSIQELADQQPILLQSSVRLEVQMEGAPSVPTYSTCCFSKFLNFVNVKPLRVKLRPLGNLVVQT